MAPKTRNPLLTGLSVAAVMLAGSTEASRYGGDCHCELAVDTVFSSDDLDMSSSSGPILLPLSSPPCPDGFTPISANCLVTTIAAGGENQPIVVGEGFSDSTGGVNLCTFAVSESGPASVQVFASLTCVKVQ